MNGKDMGIRIVSYKSLAAVVKIMRRYTGQPVSEIKSAVNRGEFVYTGDQCSGGLESMAECYKELTGAGINARLYENGREISLQLLLNLLESHRRTGLEAEAEAELEGADMEALLEYGFLWEEENDNWAVIKDDDGYTIFDRKRQSVLLIEDEDINNQAAAMMIMKGCRVLNEMPGQRQ